MDNGDVIALKAAECLRSTDGMLALLAPECLWIMVM